MITYIIKFILCSGLLLLVYRVFLGNERLYSFNRFYLLFSLVFSLAVPFVTISVPVVQIPYLDKFIAPQERVATAPIEQTAPVIIDEPIAQQNTPAIITNKPVQQPIIQAPATNYLPYILFGAYGMTVLILLLRFAKNSWHINALVTKNTIVNYQDTKLVLIEEEVTPHSFLNYVFINKDAYQSGEVEPQIICHEQAHVRQLHSLDVIFVELLQVVFWFNPFIPFYRKAIQLNHEFLADEAVIESYQDTPAYQYLLLEKASQSGSLYLTSQFNYLITKKRLIMMTKNTSAKIALYKRLAMVPLLAIAVFLFSQKSTAAILKSVEADADSIVKEKTAGHARYNGKPNDNDKPHFHIVTPKEWENIMGVRLNLPYKAKDKNIGIPTKNLKDVDVFIRKANKAYHSDYRLMTTEEFEFFVHKHNSTVKLKNKLLIIRGHISNEELQAASLKHQVKSSLAFVYSDIPVSKQDASQSVMDEYAAILSKYTFKNGFPVPQPGSRNFFSEADFKKLEWLFKQMNKKQQQQQTIAFRPPWPPLPKSYPTNNLFATWKAKKYGVWINYERVTYAELANYKATDFDHYHVYPFKASIKINGGIAGQVDLMTKAYYKEYYKQALADTTWQLTIRKKLVN